MDNRLFLAVLFGTLSWISVAGANNTTTAPASTMAMTSAGNNMTSAPNVTTATPMTSAGNNMTSAPNATTATPMTSAGNNMTSAPNATTATPMTSAGNNMTSAPNATTATPMTSAGNNMTSAPNATTATPMTSAGNNMTSAPNATMATQMTTAGNNTTAAPTTAITAAPPLVPNTTVETLETTISNTGCGTEQLCAAEPSSCDPASPGSCFFLAAKQQSGRNFEFGLAGESDGYLAASLSSDNTLGGNDTTYICANDNGTVKFFGALLNNGQLMKKELNVNSVKGKVDGKTIQCTFAATVPDPVARTSGFSLAISTGEYDSSSEDLGRPSTQLKSPVVDLGNPSAPVTNEIATNTTPSPNTTSSSYSFTLKQPLTQTLLISAGVLGLAML